jgi:nucleotide-binding universal stress UspA family protein
VGEAIVIGTDGSSSAKQALEEAVRLAQALDAELHVVSAFTPLRGARIAGPPEGTSEVWAPLPDAHVEATLSEAAATVRLAGVEVQTHAVEHDPADALLDVAKSVGAQLIVVGSRGMHGARRLVLGSVPNKVSHRADCNVLIVATDAD